MFPTASSQNSRIILKKYNPKSFLLQINWETFQKFAIHLRKSLSDIRHRKATSNPCWMEIWVILVVSPKYFLILHFYYIRGTRYLHLQQIHFFYFILENHSKKKYFASQNLNLNLDSENGKIYVLLWFEKLKWFDVIFVILFINIL